ncbi:putative F-box protein At4g22180 [Lolium perenne]|uniref:putative F-box protein At4g22180 n=1 Tax=Lolium perenne TaxID=4522 RepID=UPI003A99B48E
MTYYLTMTGPYASSSWSDLPTDLLLSILQRLELRESFAFASVCTSWCSAAADAGIPLTCRPWLMSWAHLVEERKAEISCSSAVTCQFRHLLDVNKSYDVDFPKGCFVACCGASHGWLVLVNELANLVLFNPITTEMVPLPPITDCTFVEAVYDDQGSIRGYHIFYKDKLHDAKDVATWFYQKAVLSCTPSKGGNYTVMIIHYDSNCLSFARAGESKWHVVSNLYQQDRHLVSTPWGDLLQVRANPAKRVENVRFGISMVHPEGWKKVDSTFTEGGRDKATVWAASVPQ